jgi:hypothetical protein
MRATAVFLLPEVFVVDIFFLLKVLALLVGTGACLSSHGEARQAKFIFLLA